MSQNIANVIAGLYEPYDYEDLTVDTTVGGVRLDITKIRGTDRSQPLKDAARVIMTLETASIRYTTDATPPTSSLGHLLGAGDVLILLGQPTIDNFRAIRSGGTSGTFRATFER